MFKPVDSKVDFPAQEQEILEWWEKNAILDKYLRRNDKSEKKFSFIDGPITANNPMGVHHGWGRTYKDLFQRFKTMQGYKQRYQNGFDGQGLWIEVEVEKELGLKSKRDIEKYGVDNFVNLCKERVRKFADVQTWQSIQLGYWMDWDNSYHTMSDENNYTIWHFLKVCHERGWIYEGTDVMPWCTRCGTGLSQHEIVTEGYKDITHPGLYIRLPIEGLQGEYLLIWTTTPWTLPSNTAVYVHPELIYVKARTDDGVYYLLKSRLAELKQEYEVVEEFPGRDLAGRQYRGPFDELPVQTGTEHKVVLYDQVSEKEGTGIVHAAPGAGMEDFELSKREGLSVIAPLDEFGVFVLGFDWLTGRSAFDVNEDIYANLREKGMFYRVEDYRHRYPVCWRCDTELVFRLVDEWFISMDKLRELIARVTKRIKWIPGFGLQRELDWLKNMDDWMISKKRYWGLALPIYKCKCGHFDVIGSESELEEKAVEGWQQFQGNSPHRPWIDSVKIQCSECGEMVSRIRDVGNPWLDAGIVPFSTMKYRDDRAYWREWFPGDLISESFPGQFRNWFYSLLTMSTVLEDSEPCRAVFSYAMMRDEKGNEMHKSKGNAIWFEDAAEIMGVDAMRWVYTAHRPEANLNFGFGVADEVRRGFLIPLWNVYVFFVTYANIDGYDPKATFPALAERSELDQWIISELNLLISEVTESLENYDPKEACKKVEVFVGYLSNWYVRRSRRRFWKSETDIDKIAAHSTLYECLTTLSRLLAPFVPFLTEAIYRNLVGSIDPEFTSVHLEPYPEADDKKMDMSLSESTRLAMKLSSLGRAARSKASIKVRQPLAQAMVILEQTSDRIHFEKIKHQVRDELNVKEIIEVEDESQIVGMRLEADLSKIGPLFGTQTGSVVKSLQSSDPKEIYSRLSSGNPLQVGEFELEPDHVTIIRTDVKGFTSSTEGQYTVAVTTDFGRDLEIEGLARELVHVVQNMRRSADFEIADRIHTYIKGDEDIREVIKTQGEYIKRETLSDNIVEEDGPGESFVEEHKINGRLVRICLVR